LTLAFADHRLSLEVGHAPEQKQDKGDRDNDRSDSPDAHAIIMPQAVGRLWAVDFKL